MLYFWLIPQGGTIQRGGLSLEIEKSRGMQLHYNTKLHYNTIQICLRVIQFFTYPRGVTSTLSKTSKSLFPFLENQLVTAPPPRKGAGHSGIQGKNNDKNFGGFRSLQCFFSLTWEGLSRSLIYKLKYLENTFSGFFFTANH